MSRSGDTGLLAAHLRLVRCGLALFLFVHFAQLVPWGRELFSNRGMLADGAASPLFDLLQSPLMLSDDPAFVTALLLVACGLTLPLALGRGDRWAALGLWYLWASLHARNPLIANPGMPYVGWMLLAHGLLPWAPPRLFASPERDSRCGWRFVPRLVTVAWVLLMLGYSYSGLTKLGSPAWIDGSAVGHVLNNPLARPTALPQALRSLPSVVLQTSTWGLLGLEIAAAPLALVRRARPWLWCIFVLFHLALLALLDFADLSLGMILFHWFIFDFEWIPEGHRQRLRALLRPFRWVGAHEAAGRLPDRRLNARAAP
jgi:hypothetical protein